MKSNRTLHVIFAAMAILLLGAPGLAQAGERAAAQTEEQAAAEKGGGGQGEVTVIILGASKFTVTTYTVRADELDEFLASLGDSITMVQRINPRTVVALEDTHF